MTSMQSIRERLGRIEPRRLPSPREKEAAVLIALQVIGGEAHFLFTRRTETVATHKGQISFPGGVREEEDRDLIETALRETEEEIGVPRGRVDVIGEFHDYHAVTDLLVRTVVGVIPAEVEFRLLPEEVAYVLQVPVDFFRTASPVIRRREVRGGIQDVYYFDFGGEDIWGLTARIVVDFVRFLHPDQS